MPCWLRQLRAAVYLTLHRTQRDAIGQKGVVWVVNGITIETNGLIWGAKELTVKVVQRNADDVNNSDFTHQRLVQQQQQVSQQVSSEASTGRLTRLCCGFAPALAAQWLLVRWPLACSASSPPTPTPTTCWTEKTSLESSFVFSLKLVTFSFCVLSVLFLVSKCNFCDRLSLCVSLPLVSC